MPNSAKKSTDRVRRFRERQAKGKIRVVLELDEAEADALEAAGVLKAWNSAAEDRAAIVATVRWQLRKWLARETRFIRASDDLLLIEPNQDKTK